MTAVVLSRLAERELEDAADWHEARRAGHGARLTRDVRQVLATISANPDRYPVVRGDLREASLSNYPYAIYYRIEPNRVFVVAVYHNSRDPSGWQGR